MPRHTALPGSAAFTLIELLVVLAVVALLSAVALPSFTRQISVAQSDRVVSDLGALSDAVRKFYVDTERFPADLSQLVTAPATNGTAQALAGGTIPAELADDWKGPYLNREISGSTVRTGFHAAISTALDTASWNGTRYVVLNLAEIDSLDAARVDQAMDAGDGQSAGRIRYTPAARTLKFFAMPR